MLTDHTLAADWRRTALQHIAGAGLVPTRRRVGGFVAKISYPAPRMGTRRRVRVRPAPFDAHPAPGETPARRRLTPTRRRVHAWFANPAPGYKISHFSLPGAPPAGG